MNLFIKEVLIVVMVPEENLEDVKEAIFASGGGKIGNYQDCSTAMRVEGTFRPNEKANPTVGMANKLEIVKEIRLEVICDVKYVKEVVKAIRKVHPYEEPAILIIPLLAEDSFK